MASSNLLQVAQDWVIATAGLKRPSYLVISHQELKLDMSNSGDPSTKDCPQTSIHLRKSTSQTRESAFITILRRFTKLWVMQPYRGLRK